MSNYVCPKHPEVQSERAGNCSKCGAKLEQSGATRTTTGGKEGGGQGRR